MQWIFLVVLVIILLALKILSHRRREARAVDFLMFQKRDRVMNTSEQKLFEELQRVFGMEYIVLSKVRIEDFVETRNGDGKYGARGRIKSRHVDFLICDKITTAPLLAIELDGGVHNKASVKERDSFVDELYHSISLPIQHIYVGENFGRVVAEVKSSLI
ncbi:MAG: DUF2726 domain-containing protein [Candidatus Moranbacteria bacterium]|nr:DUF2726 domain-containing protein [Candidatus Moranbacteria bacterium]